MHKEWDYEDCGHVLLGVIEGTSSFIEGILRVRSRFGGASYRCDCVLLESGWWCRTRRTEACSFEEAHKGEGEDKPGG
jgi:hypothetical protein